MFLASTLFWMAATAADQGSIVGGFFAGVLGCVMVAIIVVDIHLMDKYRSEVERDQ